MKTQTIRQSVTLNTNLKTIYEMLTVSSKHAKFTGAPAKIGKKPGEEFVCYGPYLTGYNLELVPNKRIVQLWRTPSFPKFHYSKLTILLEKVGKKTKISMKQEGVPVKDVKHLKKGWKAHYWDKMKAAL